MPDADYESAHISYVGFIDPYAVEGMLILKDSDNKEFHMRAFSGEVARHILNFTKRSDNAVPTIYQMFEEMCENNEMILVKIKVYESGDMLRANLYFTGKNDIILRNYRASDALALATLYNAPILIRKKLLREPITSD